MANLAGMYNKEIAESAPTFGVLPNGVYTVAITEEELKPNSKNTGHVIHLTMEVMEGEKSGRKLWSMINISHNNTTTMAIGQRQFTEICEQIGLDPEKVEDTSELLMKPFSVQVASEVKTGKDGKPVIGADGAPELRNIIKSFKVGGEVKQSSEKKEESFDDEIPW